jgi:hypothetical protein
MQIINIILLILLLSFILLFKIENYENNEQKKRCLITDILFPTKFSKWRLVEIFSFMNKYDTDVLVIKKVNNYGNNTFTFDYEELKDKFKLFEYDILIFNPYYNNLNKFNNNFDGTKYNNLLKADYLFRKKKFTNEVFNVNNYDFIYHIFLMNYTNFNEILKYPYKKQFIHLYPGGGTNIDSLCNLEKNIHKDVNIITTQYFISKYITRKNKIDLFGGPFYCKNEKNRVKKSIKKELTICFTSMGNHVLKGSQEYIKIVKLYKKKFPNDLVKFISIGYFDLKNDIISILPMSQDILDDYYFNNVDILINLTTGQAIDGFPLGIESILNGCLLLTTDTFNVNKLNNFNFNDFIIISKDKIEDIVNKIKLLYDNRTFYNKLVEELQNNVFDLFNYNNLLVKRFDFIDKMLL